MGRNPHEASNSRDLLRQKTSVQEILDVAMQFEKTAQDFYTDLIPKVSKRIRYLVEELAAEEAMHYQQFADLMKNPDIGQQLTQRIEKPPSNGKFSDAVHAQDLGDNPDDQAILQYALSREQAAMEQYSALAEEGEPGPIRDLFSFLAMEETEHKNELEKIYYEVVHSGGV